MALDLFVRRGKLSLGARLKRWRSAWRCSLAFALLAWPQDKHVLPVCKSVPPTSNATYRANTTATLVCSTDRNLSLLVARRSLDTWLSSAAQLCPSMTVVTCACGIACYDPKVYGCKNGGLTQNPSDKDGYCAGGSGGVYCACWVLRRSSDLPSRGSFL